MSGSITEAASMVFAEYEDRFGQPHALESLTTWKARARTKARPNTIKRIPAETKEEFEHRMELAPKVSYSSAPVNNYN